MARPGQVIEHPIFGITLTFITPLAATGGRSAVRELAIRPGHIHEGRAHTHATLTETFEILAGSARCLVGDQEHALAAGEQIVMPQGVPHIHPWNVGGDELRYRQTVAVSGDDPRVLHVDDYLVTTFGLARDGKLKPDGSPPLLQVAVSLAATLPHAYPAFIPLPVQKVLFPMLAVVGRLRGYRVCYERYERA